MKNLILVFSLCIVCGVEAGGRPQWNVVVAGSAPAPEQHAAKELAMFLGKVAGQDIPVTNAVDGKGVNLLVGVEAARFADRSFSTNGLGEEGIVLRRVGDNLILAGGTPRGTLYAVYTFLEDYAGCRWWTSDASTIPYRPNFALPARLNYRYVPPLEYRYPFWTDAFNGDWAVRNKSNGPSGLRAARYGGDMSHGGVHTFSRYISPDRYFKDHPEWFSLINGQRQHERAQLCLSNAAMRREFVQNLKAHIRKHPNPPVYSVSQNDWRNWCTCVECDTIAKRYGGQSGLMVWFVNEVAAEIEKEFPNVTLTTLAYQYTRSVPKNIRPRANVAIQLCSIECSFSAPLTAERNRAFRDDIEGWSRIANRLYIWDYVTNFKHYLLPHPNLRVLGSNIRFFVAHNAKGIFEQGAYNTPGAEFAELRAWVLAKLLWNPKLNDQRLVEEFCRGYYGPAAPNILAYIKLMHDAVEKSGDPLGCYSKTDARFLSHENLAAGWRHLQAAERAAAGDADRRLRVQVAQLPVLYAVLMRWESLRAGAKDWPFPATRQEAYAQFEKTARAKGITRLEEWREGFDRLQPPAR
jgi:hypothetical protein